MGNFLFTSESVTEGHPDKIADKISDAVLDACLKEDKQSRVACETLVTRGLIMVCGEITSKATLDVGSIVRDVLRDIGYTHQDMGCDAESIGVLVSIQKQSPDIAMGVDTGGAGDQGMMFGYACDETDVLMPMPIYLAHKLAMKLTDVRKTGKLNYLRPDGKTQVTVEYKDGSPYRIKSVVVSCHHSKDVDMQDLRRDIMENVIYEVLPDNLYSPDELQCYINPTGRFEIGGPAADTGLTGRKIIVDTYGGFGRHGGGCFSGKDPTKVDRSAAYMARHIAKNIVAAKLARVCEVQLSYVIGVPEPVSIMVNTFGTAKVSEEKLVSAIRGVFDLTPGGIISYLDLLNPIYYNTAAYGHFGREDECFTWEKTNKVEELREQVSASCG